MRTRYGRLWTLFAVLTAALFGASVVLAVMLTSDKTHHWHWLPVVPGVFMVVLLLSALCDEDDAILKTQEREQAAALAETQQRRAQLAAYKRMRSES